jgi:hypothetical protein
MVKPEPTAAVESRVRELLLDYAGTLSAVDLAAVLLKVSVDISLEEEGLEFDRDVTRMRDALASSLRRTLRVDLAEIVRSV